MSKLRSIIRNMRFLIMLLLAATTSMAFAQSEPVANRIFFYWGWNRAVYQKSDIHFTGEGYDFVLNNVAARDRQSAFNLDPYFKLNSITIPQTNMRLGYIINDKYSISIGDDHMKYVMRQYQEVTIDGYIKDSELFSGQYDNQNITLIPQFLTYEHTDGLNYINAEIRRHDTWFTYFDEKIKIASVFGVGAGIMLPKTNSKLMEKERNDEFHLAGWGTAAMGGITITFFDYFFIQSEVKGGFINMPDVRTSPDPSDKASQHFFFLQNNYVFGVSLPLRKSAEN
jgi:hypothetical protein